jgi:hypothetical protein
MSDAPPPPTSAEAVSYAVPPQGRKQGLSLAGVICAALGFCFPPLGLVGLILSVIALNRIKREPHVYGGQGQATAGMIMGIISMCMILVYALLISILLPSLARARTLAKRQVAASNLRGLGQALMIYANDYDDVFPPNLQMLVPEGTVTPLQFINPNSGNAPPACDYYYVTGLRYDDPPTWFVAWEDPNQNAGEGANVLYRDGNVQFIKTQVKGGRFEAQFQAFLDAYEQQRGAPPVILPPQ